MSLVASRSRRRPAVRWHRDDEPRSHSGPQDSQIGGAVARVSKGDGTVTLLAKSEHVSVLLQDSANLYWISGETTLATCDGREEVGSDATRRGTDALLLLYEKRANEAT